MMSTFPSLSLCFFSLLLALNILPSSSAAKLHHISNETDHIALLEFKARITDPLGVMASWNSSIHFCKWNGVTCGRRHQRVTVLDLHSSKLSGPISPHIGNLSFLQNLSLHNNSFNMEIPPELGRLSRLGVLQLRNNSLVGNIPANLSRCNNLMYLSLGNNRLSGKIPVEIGSLIKLQVLYLSQNSLVGDIPYSLGNLTSLQIFLMETNHLSETIPSVLGQLYDLKRFGVGDNGFHGTIPPSIYNLSFMEHFSVAINNLHGSLPLDLYFPNLLYLVLFENQFTGPIPPSISNSSNLEIMYLSLNNLTGRVPNLENLPKLQKLNIADNYLGSAGEGDLVFLSTLTNATDLDLLAIGYNSFGGALPHSITNLSSTRLRLFSVDNNRIFGSLPIGMGKFQSLEIFSVWGNLLSGSIPEDISKLQNLQLLYLHSNNFSGNIPPSLGNLYKLTELTLSVNKFQGSIPSSLGKCQNLLSLDISSNNLIGSIPLEIFNISSLSIILNLSRNLLTGALPMESGNLKNLGTLDVSQNMLSGVIPSNLGSCVSLEFLYMGNNFLNGTIPSSFDSLQGIKYLDLSHNNLSGEIPKFLEGFALEMLNLSFNGFSGMVPSGGIFKNASVTFVEGNNLLCGTTPELHLPICKFSKPKKRRLALKLKIIISIVLACLVIFLILTSLLVLCWLRRKSKRNVSSSSENSILQVSYQSLFEATDGFSVTNLIGVGSSASVYKGTLNSEKVVAVKVFNLQRRGASRSFMVECEALRNIRHRNLVKVITACSSIDSHGDDFKALIYEFMINGSLEEWLHPASDNPRESARNLNLLQRLNIAIDVALALDYLHHEYCQTPIVHCDLKPSNILLDDEMTAQVGDFGLMKFLSEGTNNVSTNHTSSAGVRGTVGYAAPEYGMGSEASTHGDMYSYGILLLEMFTGKKPTDDMVDDNMNIHNYVKMALPDQVAKITEATLLEGQEEDANNSERNDKVIESLIEIFRIGISCSEEMPRDRMDSSAALAKLIAIRYNLFGNRAIGGQRTGGPQQAPKRGHLAP